MPTNTELFKKYPNPIFIETGSLIGQGIQNALDSNFDDVYSIELSDKYFGICSSKFANNPKVHMIKGDSSVMLPQILKTIDKSVTFWLDGHWSMGDTALGSKPSPLIEELEVIKQHEIKTHTILIDDIRIWSSEFKISLEDVIKKFYEINPLYRIIIEDSTMFKQDILVAVI
jgi:hypothetical protein